MVSETTRSIAWEGLLRSAAAERYYDELSTRYRIWHRIVMGGLGIAAMVGVALLAFGEHLPALVKIGLNAIIVFISILGLYFDLPRKVALLNNVGMQCSYLKTKYETLWSDIQTGTLEDNEALEAVRELSDEGYRITDAIGYADIGHNEKINKKCTDIADREIARLYA